MSDNEDSDYEKQKQITEEFVEVVKNWVKLDDEIRDYTSKIKDLKNERKEFEDFILEYMETINENVIEITGGKLRRNKSNTKTPLKEESIQTALYEITKDNEKSMQMTKHIMENRPSVERVNLKTLYYFIDLIYKWEIAKKEFLVIIFSIKVNFFHYAFSPI